MNLSEETKKTLILTLFGIEQEKEQEFKEDFWKIGKGYVVRTVTMIYIGELKAINQTELLLEKCAWIPDTGRWNEFLIGKKPSEMEPYKNDVIIGRGALLDATIIDYNIKIEVL